MKANLGLRLSPCTGDNIKYLKLNLFPILPTIWQFTYLKNCLWILSYNITQANRR